MRKIRVSAIGLLLLVAIGSSDADAKARGHGHKKPCPRGTVRVHGKCRSHGPKEIASGEWSGPYTTVQVRAQGKSASISLNGFPCDGPEGGYALEDGPVQGTMSKSTVGASLTASGSYSKASYYGDTQNIAWELSGTFKTQTNFSGTLHIVVNETVASPDLGPRPLRPGRTLRAGLRQVARRPRRSRQGPPGGLSLRAGPAAFRPSPVRPRALRPFPLLRPPGRGSRRAASRAS